MEEIVRQATAILRGMWKFRWPALIVAWVVAIVAAIGVFRIPDKYEASARIYVDTQSILKPLMSGLTVQPNVEQQINMLSRTLMSRPNIEKLVRMADLDLRTETKPQQEALVDRLSREIQIRNTGRDNLYSLVYQDNDPEKAKRVIQSMVSIFVESSLGATRKDTDSAKSFLNDQIQQYETRLQEAEARMKEFRLRNIDMQTGDGKDSTARVGEIAGQLAQAQLQLLEAENARAAARAQLEAEKSQGGIAATVALLDESQGSFSTPEIDARIEAQKRNLDSLQQRFTDQHPEVVITRRLIKELEEQKRKEIAELKKTARPTVNSANNNIASLAAQELNRVIASSEIQVAALKARVSEYSSRLAAARNALKSAPQLEAEETQLNRDYGIIKKSYEELVSRRQAAVMSGELEVASGVADFRLIDPPRVSPQPVSPNRLLLLPAALLAALGAGLLVAFVAGQLRPTFDDPTELRLKTGLPLLGVVTKVVSDADRRANKMSLLRFFSASGSLVGLFVAGLIALTLTGRYAG